MTTFTGTQWLLIDLASRYGKDKLPFSERLTFGENFLPYLMVDSLEELTESLTPWLEQAKDKEMFAGCALALWDTYQGRNSSWQVGQDQCASGPQLLSVLLKCETGMKNTGAIGTEVPDPYTVIANTMGVEADRSKVKKATVPHVYGSTAVPMAVWGDEYDKFLAAYTETVPMAQMAKELMIDTWDSEATYHEWDMPDGAIAHNKVLTTVKKRGYPLGKHTYTYQYSEIGTKEKGSIGTKSNSASTTHSYDGFMLRELNRRCNYDFKVEECIQLLKNPSLIGLPCEGLQRLESLYKRFNQVSVVAIEYLNKDSLINLSKGYRAKLLVILEEVVQWPPFEIKNVHDDFMCLPNHVNRMKFWFQELLVETYQSNWWMDVYSKLTSEDHSYLKEEPKEEIIQQIRLAQYSIG